MSTDQSVWVYFFVKSSDLICYVALLFVLYWFRVILLGRWPLFLRKNHNLKTGRTQLAIVHGYRDAQGKTRHKTMLNIGYLDTVAKEYEDPIAHFEEIARQMTQAYKEKTRPVLLELDMGESMVPGTQERRNYGYAALSRIYHELDLHRFISNKQRVSMAEYDHNAIFRLLVYSRLLHPCSKKRTYEEKGQYFDRTNFSLQDMYRSLSFFASNSAAIQQWLHEALRANHGRDTSLVYYDVTNFYFEIDQQDDMRRKGVCKEHRPNPIVQMGLFVDTEGLPICFDLFAGNTLDKQTLIPMMNRLRKEYALGRSIVVADRGIISGDNIARVLLDGNGYVLSYPIRMADAAFKSYVLEEKDYRYSEEGNFRIKSRKVNRTITLTAESGKKVHTEVDEKQVIFWSRDYADKARADRAEALQKASSLIREPGKYTRATSQGAAKYVKNLVYDKKTGEILASPGKLLSFDVERLAQEEMFDGYYAIVTSEMHLNDQRVIDIYRGLWQIEEAFRVSKYDLETRPVYLSRDEHIRAHFLICFVALLLIRLLQRRLEMKFSAGTILDSLRKTSCSLIERNYYLFDYYDDVLEQIGETTGIDFSKKYQTLGEIKQSIASSKK